MFGEGGEGTLGVIQQSLKKGGATSGQRRGRGDRALTALNLGCSTGSRHVARATAPPVALRDDATTSQTLNRGESPERQNPLNTELFPSGSSTLTIFILSRFNIKRLSLLPVFGPFLIDAHK